MWHENAAQEKKTLFLFQLSLNMPEHTVNKAVPNIFSPLKNAHRKEEAGKYVAAA